MLVSQNEALYTCTEDIRTFYLNWKLFRLVSNILPSFYFLNKNEMFDHNGKDSIVLLWKLVDYGRQCWLTEMKDLKEVMDSNLIQV